MKQKNYIIVCFLIYLSLCQNLSSQKLSKKAFTVDSCIQIALENNLELKVFEQEKEIALKQHSIKKGYQIPTINVVSEYGYTNQFKNLDVFNAGNSSIQLYQPVWQNGKIKYIIDQAKVNTEVANIQFLINRSDITYYTVESYINLLRNTKINQLANIMTQQFSITVDAAKEMYKLGISKRSDVLKAETEYSNVKFYAIQIRTSKNVAGQYLLKAIGNTFDTAINTVCFLSETYTDFDNICPDSLIRLACINLPEFMLIRKQIQKQELSVLIEKKKQFPELSAYASYNWSDNPLYPKEYFTTTGLSLRFDLFNGFQKKNTVELEKVKLQQLNLQENEIFQSICNEIRIAQMMLMESREKINNAKARAKSSKETLDVTKEEYSQGLSSMIELIEAQYANFNANQNLINAQADYHLAVAMLKRKIGFFTTQHRNY